MKQAMNLLLCIFLSITYLKCFSTVNSIFFQLLLFNSGLWKSPWNLKNILLFIFVVKQDKSTNFQFKTILCSVRTEFLNSVLCHEEIHKNSLAVSKSAAGFISCFFRYSMSVVRGRQIKNKFNNGFQKVLQLRCDWTYDFPLVKSVLVQC